MILHAKTVAGAGYGVLLVDLRGHGQSDLSRFDRAAAVEDALAAIGLGGMVALQAAARSKYINAVAADDPLPATIDDLPPPAGVVDLLWRYPQAYLFLSAVDRFAGAAHLSANTRALARLAGRPVWLSSAGRGPQQRRARHLSAAARRPKTLHEFPLAAPDAYADRLLAFFGPALAVDGAAGEWPADDTGPAATPTAAPGSCTTGAAIRARAPRWAVTASTRWGR